jgi:hypothetical protein
VTKQAPEPQLLAPLSIPLRKASSAFALRHTLNLLKRPRAYLLVRFFVGTLHTPPSPLHTMRLRFPPVPSSTPPHHLGGFVHVNFRQQSPATLPRDALKPQEFLASPDAKFVNNLPAPAAQHTHPDRFQFGPDEGFQFSDRDKNRNLQKGNAAAPTQQNLAPVIALPLFEAISI